MNAFMTWQSHSHQNRVREYATAFGFVMVELSDPLGTSFCFATPADEVRHGAGLREWFRVWFTLPEKQYESAHDMWAHEQIR